MSAVVASRTCIPAFAWTHEVIAELNSPEIAWSIEPGEPFSASQSPIPKKWQCQGSLVVFLEYVVVVCQQVLVREPPPPGLQSTNPARHTDARPQNAFVLLCLLP